jgi:serine/threonine protein kinase
MRPEVAEDAVALQRFFNEAKASGRVRSPSIVEILDLGQAEDGSPFLVFELLDGEGLDALLKREGTISRARSSS